MSQFWLLSTNYIHETSQSLMTLQQFMWIQWPCMQNLLYLERVVGSTMIQIMAKACNQQSQTFNLTKYFPPLGNLKWKSIIKTVYWVTSLEYCHTVNIKTSNVLNQKQLLQWWWWPAAPKLVTDQTAAAVPEIMDTYVTVIFGIRWLQHGMTFSEIKERTFLPIFIWKWWEIY
jgi:hypothetical protein